MHIKDFVKTDGMVDRVFIEGAGDHSVGILTSTACITGPDLIDIGVLSEEDRLEFLEEFRSKVKEAFALIWDTEICVTFDFEEETYDPSDDA